MELTRAEIVEGLQQILGSENVSTDEELLRQRSIDNFRKLENIFGVYTLPAPAAVAMVRSTWEAAEVLAFAASEGPGYLTGTDILVDGGTRAGQEFQKKH